MSRDIPRGGVVLVVAVICFAIGVFIYLVPRFGGPTLGFSNPYHLNAQFHDTLALEKSAGVFIRGVSVGSVSGIDVHGDTATVTFTVDRRYAPLHSDATARIGLKTALGEPFVDLTPGTPAGALLRDNGQITHTKPTVTVDQALTTLAAPNRGRIISLLHTFSDGGAAPLAQQQFNATIVQTTRFVDQLNRLTSTLHGQEADISRLIGDGRTVLGALGSRQQSLTTIVHDGSVALAAVATRDLALRAGIHEFPPLLQSARNTLITAQPLLTEAAPVVDNLAAAAPKLTVDFNQLGPVAADANTVLARLPAFNRTAVPVLRRAVPAIDVARPVLRGLPPALANLIPSLTFLESHKRELAAWFSQTRASSQFGDAKGKFYRFFIFGEPDTLLGVNAFGQLAGSNPYTLPGDANVNRPYKPGDYHRLMPYPTWSQQ